MSASSDAFVHWFRSSAPYIHAHRGRTFVIVFGGELLETRGARDFIHDVALLQSLGIRVVLVAGARPQIDAALARRGAEPRYVAGMRVTDDVALACVKEAAGTIHVELEALFSTSLPNSPMAGARVRVASGNFVTARPVGVIDGVDYVHSGLVRKIDAEAIGQRLDDGAVVRDWALAEKVAVRSAGREPFAESYHYASLTTDFEELTALAEQQASTAQKLAISLTLQGCQEDGICYPPMKRKVSVDLPAGTITPVATTDAGAPQSEQDRLAAALGGDKNARLTKRLVYDEQVATSVVVANPQSEIAGQFRIIVTAKPDADLAKIEAEIYEELNRLISTGPTQAEIDKNIVQTVSGVISGLESTSSKAAQLAQWEMITGDPNGWKASLNRLEAATPATVQAVARKWLTRGSYTLTVLPFGDPQSFSPAVDRSKMPAPGAIADAAFPDYETATLSNGVKVMLVERHDVPQVSVSMLLDTGYPADQATIKDGLSGLTANMLDEGTTTRSALQIAEYWEIGRAHV